MKYFNIAGPCIEGKHYMLDATERLHGELIELINSEQYFVIHAARQVGKTTLLINLANKINKEGKYYAVYCSLENAYGIVDPEKGIKSIIGSIKSAVKIFSAILKKPFTDHSNLTDFSNSLMDSLTDFCATLDKPLILFFDEADCLS